MISKGWNSSKRLCASVRANVCTIEGVTNALLKRQKSLPTGKLPASDFEQMKESNRAINTLIKKWNDGFREQLLDKLFLRIQNYRRSTKILSDQLMLLLKTNPMALGSSEPVIIHVNSILKTYGETVH